MVNPPRATVVIAFYRNDATLGEQLEALATQRDAPSFEVVVADNEGSPRLNALLEPFSERLRLRVVQADQQRGQSHARNVGASAAQCDHLLFCDADDIVGPFWVASLHHALTQRDVLATGPLRVDRLNREIVWKTYLSAGADTGPSEPHLVRPFSFLGYLPFAVGCSLAMRRDTYRRLGGFDSTMRGGSEDVDLSWRAQEAGVEIMVVEEALADYRLRDDAMAVFRQRRSYERSKMRLWVRSRRLGRPVLGMSLRWALRQTLSLGPRWVRLRKAAPDIRYVEAFRAGGIIGNLESQITTRFLRIHR